MNQEIHEAIVSATECVIRRADTWGSWSKSPLYSDDEMIRKKEKAIIKHDLKFVNRYLEHSLSNGGRQGSIGSARQRGSPPPFALSTCF